MIERGGKDALVFAQATAQPGSVSSFATVAAIRAPHLLIERNGFVAPLERDVHQILQE